MEVFRRKRLFLHIEAMLALAINAVMIVVGCCAVTM
jgi:hypothetical protein